LYAFDKQSLLVFAENFHNRNNPDVQFQTTYYQISKTNGVILDSLNLPNNRKVNLLAECPDGSLFGTIYPRLTKSVEGFYLCNPETDTVYNYTKDKSLIPVFCKIPSVSNLDPMVVLPNVVNVSKYQFFKIVTIKCDDALEPDRYYFRDKETNKIFRQKIVLPDYKGKEIFIFANNKSDIGYLFELDLIELKKAYKENRLSGKLKELVDTLNELEDNNVLMLVRFK